MGGVAARWIPSLKRSRVTAENFAADDSEVSSIDSSVPLGSFAGVHPLLHMVYVAGEHQSEPVCRSVVQGREVEETYGCHYHFYPTSSPQEAHGTALGWHVGQEPLSALSLLTLCRVGNSCRKKVVVVADEDIGIALKYIPTL